MRASGSTACEGFGDVWAEGYWGTPGFKMQVGLWRDQRGLNEEVFGAYLGGAVVKGGDVNQKPQQAPITFRV